MSFSLSQVKCKKMDKQTDIKECYGLIKGMLILTENIKVGLWKYADFRFSRRCSGRLTKQTLMKMIQELLESVCGKSYKDITYKDVSIFENEILYQIKRAIIYGATKSLYYGKNDITNADDLFLLSKVAVKIDRPAKSNMQYQDVLDYFKDTVVA